jgi:hypothetical protein
MKYPNLFILLILLVFISCGSKYKLEKQPIVDIQGGRPEATRMRNRQLDVEKTMAQTEFVYKGNSISEKQFKQLFNQNKVKELVVLKKENEITDLGFDYKLTKQIIVIK